MLRLEDRARAIPVPGGLPITIGRCWSENNVSFLAFCDLVLKRPPASNRLSESASPRLSHGFSPKRGFPIPLLLKHHASPHPPPLRPPATTPHDPYPSSSKQASLQSSNNALHRQLSRKMGTTIPIQRDPRSLSHHSIHEVNLQVPLPPVPQLFPSLTTLCRQKRSPNTTPLRYDVPDTSTTLFIRLSANLIIQDAVKLAIVATYETMSKMIEDPTVGDGPLPPEAEPLYINPAQGVVGGAYM